MVGIGNMARDHRLPLKESRAISSEVELLIRGRVKQGGCKGKEQGN